MLSKVRAWFFLWLLPLLTFLPLAIHASELDELAQSVERTESLRAVKDLQRNYAHYAQFGLWDDMASLFTADATFTWDTRSVQGKAKIAAWLRHRGGNELGPVTSWVTTELIEEPLINLAADGSSAKGRWMGLSLLGESKYGARIEGGIYENTYVHVNGVWLFSSLHFYPQYSGTYEQGWINTDGKDLPLVPFHFTPEEAGAPIAHARIAAPATRASLAQLEQRISALNDEDAIRNLQNAYGYYVDRKMWDDVADLFANDAALEIAGAGIYAGKSSIRRALQVMGSAGLQRGQLNDRPMFDTIVEISAGNREAFARGIELGMLGEADQGKAEWELTVFRNRFVKEAGIWKLRELRLYPLLRADYFKGWVSGRIQQDKPTGTLAPDGVARANYSAARVIPAFLSVNPVTKQPVRHANDMFVVGDMPLTPRIDPGKETLSKTSVDARLTDAQRRLKLSVAFDGAENVSAAYGYYLDDSQWPQMGAIFADKGNNQAPLAGYYLGRERITQAATAAGGAAAAATRPGINFHWRIQPVILVAADGRSVNLRTRLFQPRTGKELSKPGEFYAAGFHGGMYPNDQVVLEKGVWRLWSSTSDGPYFTSADWKAGWASGKNRKSDQAAEPGALLTKYPPDVATSELGKREEHLEGGTGATLTWPDILPMWFNYRNPVSGRTPENYWPDCVPCEKVPAAKMTAHGYLTPRSGAPD